MGYREDFNNGDGWNAVDVSLRLNNRKGEAFLKFLKQRGVDTIIRYYASTPRPKTLTLAEAKLLSREGFGILPVYQDSSRSIENFGEQNGRSNAASALQFAERIGQPVGKGSTILFAIDRDYTADEIRGPIRDYFAAIKDELGDKFRIGAYGGGTALLTLMQDGLIEVPWISMSRLFLGTQQFFYSDLWALRQLPPEMIEPVSGVEYDRDVVRAARSELGAFQIAEDGRGLVAWSEDVDATLNGSSAFLGEARVEAADLFVATDGLRLRAEPDGQVIEDLAIGDPLVALGDSGVPGWRHVRAGNKEGFCFEKYIRAPAQPEVEALMRAALDEWFRFNRGRGSEKVDPYCQYVGQMWTAIGERYDGRSRYPNGEDVPWSGAFISWVVKCAGPFYSSFLFSSGHAQFVNNAIKSRIVGRTDKPFWGYRISEEKPKLGDIIQRNRGGNNFSFAYAENHESYESHSDIVVEVQEDIVRVLGGNVGNTVGFRTDLQEYRLNEAGFLAEDQGLISILKNRAGG